MNSKRVVFLLLAVIVAGTTAFLARAWLQGERAAILAQAGVHREAPAMPTAQVLVAKTAVHLGQIVKPDMLRWQPWPQNGLAPTYIVEGKRKMDDFVGSVARSPIAAGEPISESKLVLSGTRGFMAAVLKPGTRAVSVPITASSAVSGFIYAGDRVDVLLTLVLQGAQGQHNATETILRNARVIGMDQKVDFSPGDKPDVAKTATLELTPKQTEIVTLALKMGDLSLALRSLQDSLDANAPDEDDAAAVPGDSYTRDVQVSRLMGETPPPPDQAPSIVVLRGSKTSQQESGESASGGFDEPRKSEGKSSRSVSFTRTPSPSQ
jgi:pilus assembly protein CpaB